MEPHRSGHRASCCSMAAANSTAASPSVALLSMAVLVMQVGVMRMPVSQLLMAVPVGMRFAWRVDINMDVAMMLVVQMAMLVLDRLVNVVVLMPFGQMQPEANGHQHTGGEQACR